MTGIGWPLFMFGVAAFLAVIAIRPRATWRALAGWQFKNPDAVELTDSMLVLRSVSAGLGALLTASFGIWLLATEDERECEQILAKLGDAAAGVDFDSSDEEFGDYSTGRLRLERVAEDLDVELDERGPSADVVNEHGEVLGTIDERGVESRCDGVA